MDRCIFLFQAIALFLESGTDLGRLLRPDEEGRVVESVIGQGKIFMLLLESPRLEQDVLRNHFVAV